MTRKTPVVTEKKIKEGDYSLPTLCASYDIYDVDDTSIRLQVSGQWLDKPSLYVFIKDLKEIYDVLKD